MPLTLPLYVPGQTLWHVSDLVLTPGQAIGPHIGASPHWLRVRADPAWAAVEDTFEQLRPPAMVTRQTCVFATDAPELIQSMVKGRSTSLVYSVDVPPHAKASGRFDLKLVNPALNPALVANDYWAMRPNGNVGARPEVLATELLVVIGLGAKFAADVRKLPLWRDLTRVELQQGFVGP